MTMDDVGQSTSSRGSTKEHEKRVFLSGNLHLPDHPLPNEDEIVSYLEEAWDKTHQFVSHLDGPTR